mmetsp:Transcript_111927/g.316310  ORF Transcript_111927/g.316310 Transcript_111927/m.316310 type:complete len:206 (-) Transcript_111927:460-1077(-)
MRAPESPRTAARAATSWRSGSLAKNKKIQWSNVGKISAPPIEADTTKGKASSKSHHPARFKDFKIISLIRRAPGGGSGSPPPFFPNLLFPRISLYSFVAAMNSTSSESAIKPSLPKSAHVTTEYIECLTASAGHGCGLLVSNEDHKRGTASSTAAQTAASLKLASNHAFCRSLMTAASPGSLVKNKKSPKGSLKDAGRPQHSGVP